MSKGFVKRALLATLLVAGFVVLWVVENVDRPAPVPSVESQSTATPTVPAPALVPDHDPQKPVTEPEAREDRAAAENLPLPPETVPNHSPPLPPQNAPEAVPDVAASTASGSIAEDSAAVTEVPAPKETSPAEAADAGEDVIKGTLSKGDTVSKLLEPHVDANAVQDIITATRRVFPLTSFRAGQPYVLVCDVQSGTVKRFEYEIDRKRRLVVEGEGTDTPVARVELIEYDTKLELVGGRIDDNLFQSVADLGESPQLALLIANLFGWEVNFIRDLQDGDSFSILVEKLYREGQFRGYGRTLGATFTNKGKTYEAFLFYDARGQEHHYNVRGENLRKTLLQAPLSFTRVTSGYTRSRKHPIFGDHRAHFGVDYGAPTGTPVKAVGDGEVTLRGWAGGYGNQVVVRHSAGLESMYSHLSGFARGISKGSRVRQGQVIAFVGSTGNSTGPHLDFRLKQNGQFVNPTKAVNPRSESVSKARMSAFTQRMNLVRSFMNGTRSTNAYTPDMITVSVTVQKESSQEAAQDEKPVRKRRR